jgi:hypothetical protein
MRIDYAGRGAMRYNQLTHNFVASEINNRGGELLTTYVRSSDKLKIRCLKDDYIWEPTWNINAGHWCPKCRNRPKITIDDVRALVEVKNGILIHANEPIHAKEKITVSCARDGHVWHPTWDEIRSGNWCPKCSGKILMTFKELKEFVASKGAKIINGPRRFVSTDKFKIKCLKDNHVWEPMYCAIVYNGTWCPKCSGKVRKSFKEIKKYVKGMGGVVVSKEKDLTKRTDKLKIRCAQRHTWSVSYGNLVYNNRWCPFCKTSQEQGKLLSLIESILDIKCKFNFKGFEWLKDLKRMEIDIWAPSIKLAIEYDGPHHYKQIAYYGDKEKAKIRLKDRKRKDRLKTRLIKAHPNEVAFFIRFSYKEKLTKEYVEAKLRKHGVLQQVKKDNNNDESV